MARTLDFPVFDADNHLYETRDSFTRHLPERYKGAIDYVDLHGRTKIMIRGTVSDYIPNPTFEVVARPGSVQGAEHHPGPGLGVEVRALGRHALA